MLNPILRALPATALALALTVPTLTVAHSRGEATVPANGAVLSDAPTAIEMQFEAPMRITLISLTDANGVAHDLNRTDDMQPVTAFAASPASALPAGQYTVEWRGLSADGHPMSGRFAFEIAE